MDINYIIGINRRKPLLLSFSFLLLGSKIYNFLLYTNTDLDFTA